MNKILRSHYIVNKMFFSFGDVSFLALSAAGHAWYGGLHASVSSEDPGRGHWRILWAFKVDKSGMIVATWSLSDQPQSNKLIEKLPIPTRGRIYCINISSSAVNIRHTPY